MAGLLDGRPAGRSGGDWKIMISSAWLSLAIKIKVSADAKKLE